MVPKTGIIGIFDDFLIATEAIKVTTTCEKNEFEEEMKGLMEDITSFKEFRRRFDEAYMFGCVRRRAGYYYLPYEESNEIDVEDDRIYIGRGLLEYEEGVEPVIINYTKKEILIKDNVVDKTGKEP